MTQERQNWTHTAGRIVIATSFGPIGLIMAGTGRAGTVLLVHGRNGAPGQAQIAEIANAYLDRGWRVVAPELPNSTSCTMNSNRPNTMSRNAASAASPMRRR